MKNHSMKERMMALFMAAAMVLSNTSVASFASEAPVSIEEQTDFDGIAAESSSMEDQAAAEAARAAAEAQAAIDEAAEAAAAAQAAADAAAEAAEAAAAQAAAAQSAVDEEAVAEQAASAQMAAEEAAILAAAQKAADAQAEMDMDAPVGGNDVQDAFSAFDSDGNQEAGALMDGIELTDVNDSDDLLDDPLEGDALDDEALAATHPAFSFNDVQLAGGSVLNIQIPAGALPEGTDLAVRGIDLGENSEDPRAQAILEKLSKAVGLGDGILLDPKQVNAYDFFFYDDAVGETPHIAPGRGVDFTVQNISIEGEPLYVYAIPDSDSDEETKAYRISDDAADNAGDGQAAVKVENNMLFGVIAVVAGGISAENLEAALEDGEELPPAEGEILPEGIEGIIEPETELPVETVEEQETDLPVETVEEQETDLPVETVEEQETELPLETVEEQETDLVLETREEAETEEEIRKNLVTFESTEGIVVTCDGEDVTNGTAYAVDGMIIFTVETLDGYQLESVLVDGSIPARKTVDEEGNESENVYIIENIQTDETIVASAAVEKEMVLVEKTLSEIVGANEITVSGNLPEDAQLQVTAIPIENAEEIVEALLGDSTDSKEVEDLEGEEAEAEELKNEVLFAYDISIISGGKLFQPEEFGESVKVEISNVENTQDTFDVLHVKAEVTDEEGNLDQEVLSSVLEGDASYEKIEAYSGEDAAFFTTTGFSLFIGTQLRSVVAPSGAPELVVKYRDIDVENGLQTFSCIATGTLYIQVKDMPVQASERNIVVDVPTGWQIVGYSAVPNTTAISGLTQIDIDDDYLEEGAAVRSSTIEPKLGESPYGTVAGTKWADQKLEPDHYNQTTYGGKITYVLDPNMTSVELFVDMKPQPRILDHVSDTERMPDVTVTLTCGEEILTSTLESKCNLLAVERLAFTRTSYNVSVDGSNPGQSARIFVGGRVWGSTAASTPGRQQYADYAYYTISYPEGIFFDADATDHYFWGTGAHSKTNLTVNEGPNGGGTITYEKYYGYMEHSSSDESKFKLYFYAKTGEGTYPEAARTWNPGEKPMFRLSGQITRNGKTRSIVSSSNNQLTRTFIGGDGDKYRISIGKSTIKRRDLTADLGYEDEYVLANCTLNSALSYPNVHFKIENEDNKLGIVSLGLVGNNIRDVEIITTTGRPIHVGAISGECTQYDSVKTPNLGLQPGEYISSCTYVANLPQQYYSDAFSIGAFVAFGRFVNGESGRINIGAVDAEGNYLLNPQEQEIKGYAAVTVANNNITFAATDNTISKKKDGGHAQTFYPGEHIYGKSVYSHTNNKTKGYVNSTVKYYYTQNTIIDPTIYIVVPEGVVLDTNKVTAKSKAGNYNGTEFPLYYTGEVIPITRRGVECKAYKFVSYDHFDMVARELYSTKDKADWTGAGALRAITVYYEADILLSCDEYINLQTRDMVLWNLDSSWDRNRVDNYLHASDGQSTYDDSFVTGVKGIIEPVANNKSYEIKPLKGLHVNLEIKSEQSGEDYVQYVKTNPLATTAKVQEDKLADVRIYYNSSSDKAFGSSAIYVPIPREEMSYTYFTNIADSIVEDPAEMKTFAFDMFLNGPVTMEDTTYNTEEPTTWTTYYAVYAEDNESTYTEAEDPSLWEPVLYSSWVTEDQITDWNSVVMVKFVADRDIPPAGTGEAVMKLRVAKEAEFDTVDYWRGYARHALPGAASIWESTNVIAATPTSATLEGMLFLDYGKDGAMDDEDTGYQDQLYSITVSKDDNTIANILGTLNADGSFSLIDDSGYPIYLLKGDYTVEIVNLSDENRAYFEQVPAPSGMASDGTNWYNDIINEEVTGIEKAKYHFTVDKSGTIVEDRFVPEIYYCGVGLTGITVSVKKLVEGLAADKEKQFDFVFSVIDGQGDPITEKITDAFEPDASFVEFDTEGYYYFSLSDEDSCQFAWLPYNSIFVFEEDDYEEEYETTVKINEEDAAEDTAAIGQVTDLLNDTKVTYTNTRVIDIPVKKIWDDVDDQDGKRPDSVTVTLYADEEPYGDPIVLTVNEEEEELSWTGVWERVPVSKDGEAITYTVKEDEVDYYTTEYEGDAETGFIITNKHEPEKIDVTVKKVWDDADDQDGLRPSVVYVKLMADGEPYDNNLITLDASNEWTVTYTDLFEFSHGEPIEYTFRENAVDYYTTGEPEIETVTAEDDENDTIAYKITITNTHVPETVDVPVQKEWEDSDNQDGSRPDSVILRLLANNHAVLLKEETEETGDGTEGGTTGQTEGGDTAGDETSASQDTNWDPAYKVELTAENQEEDNPNMWTYVFKGLPKYDHGHVIVYTVIEDVPENYSMDIKGNAVINRYTPDKTSVTVTKAWDDNNNQDGKRPTEVLIDLLADEEVVETITLTEGNGWTYSWQGLDAKKNDGESSTDIVYTVEEHDIEEGDEYGDTGYKLESIEETVEGSGSWIITNTYEPETINVTVNKTWDDNEDQDGARPEDGITVRLLANGVFYDKKTGEDGKICTWEDLPKYENGKEILYTVTEDAVPDYATEITPSGDEDGLIFDITNSYTPGETSVTVTKSWDDEDDYDGLRPESVEVQLKANGEDIEVEEGEEEPYTVTLSEANGWTYTWTGLAEKADGEDITYTVEEAAVEGYDDPAIGGDAVTGFVITNIHEVEKVKISGNKEWKDEDESARPYSIRVSLYADGAFVDARVTTELNEWKFDFGELPKFVAGSEEGTEIVYTLIEDPVDGYETSYEQEPGEGSITFTVTNTIITIPETTSVSVKKIWDDDNDRDGVRPDSVLVDLKVGEDVIGTASLSAANGWYYEWEGLAKTDAEGEPVEYEVVEQEDNLGEYEAGGAEDCDGAADFNYQITNTYEPKKIEIVGHKTWMDNNNQDGKRPDSITIRLYANGEFVDDQEVSGSQDTEYTFTGLWKYDNGIAINYTVTEDAVPEYSTQVTGFEIVNTYTPGKTSVTVMKRWDDANNQDGKRPESVAVELKAGEDTVKTAQLSAGTGWMYTFTDLDLMADGDEIEYTVEESTDDLGEYEQKGETEGDAKTGFIITNAYTPETTEISVTKVWDDKSNNDDKRPEDITVKLYADGVEVASQTVDAVTEEDTQEITFQTDDGEAMLFPIYENGRKIVYTITEDSVADYTTEIEGFTITNTYEPGMTTVTVMKVWDDGDDQDGKRPESVEVQLYADGKAITQRTDTAAPNPYLVTLSEANGWATSWDVPLMVGGKVVEYTVDETEVPEGYEKTVLSDSAAGNTVIKNTYVPETTDITVTKVWDDEDDQDGIRPATVMVVLKGDTKTVPGRVVALSDANGWSYTWTGLPVYEKGNEITYDVEETVPEGYTAQVEGEENIFTITNTHAPETTTVTVKKVWEDEDDKDGKRPENITITLLADGDMIETRTVSSDDAVEGITFESLPRYRTGTVGEAIVYTVAESSIDGYIADITLEEAKADDAGTEDEPAEEGEETEETAEEGINKTFIITNTYRPGKTSVLVTKAWDDADDADGKRMASVTVTLKADGQDAKDAEGNAITATLSDANSWTYIFQDLDVNKNDGSGSKKIVYSVVEGAVTDYTTTYSDWAEQGFITVTNTHERALKDITVEKVWEDDDNRDGIRPASVRVILKADNHDVQETVTELSDANNWSYTWKDLPVNAGGKAIEYEVEEVVPDGYTPAVYLNGDNFTIENYHEPETVNVTATKVWDDNDNQDGMRDDVILGLFKSVNGSEPEFMGGDEPEEQTVKAPQLRVKADGPEITIPADAEGPDLTVTWEGLPKYENGIEILYTVQEKPIEGYKTVITGDMKTGYTVTNIHEPETVRIDLIKIWEDADDQDGKRPETVTVKVKGEVKATPKAAKASAGREATVVLKAADGWRGYVDGLPKYENGELLAYTVEEDAIASYETIYDPADQTAVFNENNVAEVTITNTHEPEKVNVTVTKVWDDKDDQDGIRPETVTVKLLADGVQLDEAVLGKAAAAEEGSENAGTNTEENAGENNGENTEENAGENNGTNTGENAGENNGEKKAVRGEGDGEGGTNENDGGTNDNTANDANAGEGTGEAAQEGEAADPWKHTFEALPKYKDGKEIAYTVVEASVPNYTTDISGSKTTNEWTITNSYTPGKTSVMVAKAWVDEEDLDQIRPKQVKVELYADGEATGKTLTLGAENVWTGIFKDLDLKKEGKEIVYTVVEADVPGYEAAYGDWAEEGFITVTNTHEVGKTDYTIEVQWDDNQNQDGVRPAYVTVYLMKDGERVAGSEHVITEADGWTYTWKNLAAKKYTIGVEEVEETEAPQTEASQTETPPTEAQGGEESGQQTGTSVRMGVRKVVFAMAPAAAKEDRKVALTSETGGDDNTNTTGDNNAAAEPAGNEGGTGDAAGAGNGEAAADAAEPAKTTKITLTDEDVAYTADEVQPLANPAYTQKSITHTAVKTTIVNEYSPETVDITGQKIWNDNNNQDGVRPESITVYLYADGVYADKLTLTSAGTAKAYGANTTSAYNGTGVTADANTWVYSFTGLPKYKNGAEVNYTVSEKAVSGYTMRVNGYDITNTYTPGKTFVSVIKVWDDNRNEENLRPDNIIVRLYADGTEVDRASIGGGNGWFHVFTGLDEKKEGKDIVYTITEDTVPEYLPPVITGSAAEGFTITNSLLGTISGKTVTVTKNWQDKDGNAISWPSGATVTVSLLANGQATDHTAVLSASSPTMTFTGLSDDITYTITESSVSGISSDYSVSVSGSDTSGFTITNKLKKDNGGNNNNENNKNNNNTNNNSSNSSSGGGSTSSGGGGSSGGGSSISGGGGSSVKTGDETPIMLWLIVAMMAAAVGAGAVFYRKRRKWQE